MCGIVGYIGSRNAESILIEGLQRLEYRGYDSAGLAFLEKREFRLVRAKGKLANLIQKMKEVKTDATLGIGHTRWATHGKPSEENAHPHFSKDVTLVHNGIIENYQILKQELLKKGFEFTSETDTEVICHLLQDHLNQGKNFELAFQQTIQKIEGAFALVVLHRLDLDRFFVAKKGSPLVIGKGKGENFVASDIPALLTHTREIIFLEDGEMAILNRDDLCFFDFQGKVLKKQTVHIPWSASQAEKEGYKHFMLKEIMEQPRALTDTILGRIDRKRNQVSFEGSEDLLAKCAHPESSLQIVACGTSFHAGLVGKFWIERLARLPVNVDLSSEFRYRDPLFNEHTVLIPISQSGETADTLAVVDLLRNKNLPILSICNVMEASIPRKSERTLYTYAGPEIGVASTKAFTTQLAILYLLALKLAEVRKTLSSEEIALRLNSLAELPRLMEDFLLHTSLILVADQIYRKENCYFLGRGIQFPIVLEGALKLKEISYIHAEGYAGGEMKHGPIALIEENVPVIAVAVKDSLYEKMVSNIAEVAARGAKVFVLLSKEDEILKSEFKNFIEIPKTHDDLYPFLTVLPLQLLAYHVADHKGTDIDQPRNLAKSVTVE